MKCKSLLVLRIFFIEYSLFVHSICIIKIQVKLHIRTQRQLYCLMMKCKKLWSMDSFYYHYFFSLSNSWSKDFLVDTFQILYKFGFKIIRLTSTTLPLNNIEDFSEYIK